MAETEDLPLDLDAIRVQIAEAKRKKDDANLKRDTKQRRGLEAKQRKERVNASLLRGQSPGRDETWTIRAKAEHIKAVKALAQDLSEPHAKVTISALMDEAVELLLAKYRGAGGDAVET